MGKHSGPEREEAATALVDATTAGSPARRPQSAAARRRRLLVLATAATATIVAWGLLVFAAITFGVQGRDGTQAAWFFLALATVGAVACLFLGLVLATKLLVVVRAATELPPPVVVPGGGKRARRD